MIEKQFIKKNTVWQFDKFYHDNLLGLFFSDWKMIQGAKQAKKTRDLFSKKNLCNQMAKSETEKTY